MSESLYDDIEYSTRPVIFQMEYRIASDDMKQVDKSGNDKLCRIDELIIHKGTVYFKSLPNISVHIEMPHSDFFAEINDTPTWYKIAADPEAGFSHWADVSITRCITSEEWVQIDLPGDEEYDGDYNVFGETLGVKVFTHHLKVNYTKIVEQAGKSIGVGKFPRIDSPTDEFHLFGGQQLLLPPNACYSIGGSESQDLPEQYHEIIIS